MKPAARRLGRGLGAFLDFGPAGDDGAAHVSEVIGAPEATSILETSAPAPKPSPPPKPVPPALRPAARPVPAAAAPPSPPKPVPAAPQAAKPAAEEEPAYVDEEVVGLSFPDVELE